MIVATAGHIDHGKTQLIKALTGINTDRLPEEKKRGMSIDLGFAYKDLGNGITIGFVDVPGHARFINNMLAGVAGIDFSLLVIAADDGPMPQTLEHLAILDFLEINRGAVVISKVDKVNTERTEEVKEVTKSLLKGTRFEKVPLFQVASILNLGVKNLLKYIEDEAEKTIKKEASGNFRLAIDRSFSLKGSGVVVTGSVFSGCASVGDEFILSPKGKKVRIRAIHSQNKVSKKTFTGERCALNITGTGINANSISRGDWILSNYINYSSIRMDADIRVMTDKVKPLKHWTPAHIHLGTAKVTCRIAILQNKMLQPGGKGFVQLVLNKPISCFYGDHFILRDVSAETTIAGGIIIDPFSLGSPMILTELFFFNFSKPYSITSFSCSIIFLIPIFSINLIDSEKPTTSAVCSVPASYFVGLLGKVILSFLTSSIIPPPPWYGGSLSNHSFLAYKTPTPVGPYIL